MQRVAGSSWKNCIEWVCAITMLLSRQTLNSGLMVLPRSDRRAPQDPGAAVYWRNGDKKLVLACDKYTSVGENLYAIGKTIEATRGIERWGAVTAEQAFAGGDAEQFAAVVAAKDVALQLIHRSSQLAEQVAA